MVMKSSKDRFISIFILIIVMLLIFLIIGIKRPTIGTSPIKEIAERWLPSFTSTNVSQTLSLYLIQNRIYPRHTNLTNVIYHKRKMTYNNVSYPLFITMADVFYLPAVRNFQIQLRNYGLEKNLILLCLDIECVKLSRSKNVFAWWGFVNVSVARLKFDVMIDLSEAGFDFILFDSDVFLSPSHHPLSYMSDFTDTSWDIQFQLDSYNEQSGDINIGWFWARPSVQTIEYFIRSKQRWELVREADQTVMNKVLAEIERLPKVRNDSKSLAIRRLNPKKFLNFMLTYWFGVLSPQIGDQTNFYNLDENIRYDLMKNASEETVIWHYTCVTKPLKMFFAKYFGQWTNLDGYYTKKRKFLACTNLGQGSKDSKILLRQFLIAVKIALISGRTLIFPNTVVRHPINKFPAVRTFSTYEIELKGIEYVEPTFVHNRKIKHGMDISSQSMFDFSAKNKETVVDLARRTLEELDASLKWKELVVLDFSQFHAFTELLKIDNFDEWWKKSMNINDRLDVSINDIRLCRNINNKDADCGRVCT